MRYPIKSFSLSRQIKSAALSIGLITAMAATSIADPSDRSRFAAAAGTGHTVQATGRTAKNGRISVAAAPPRVGQVAGNGPAGTGWRNSRLQSRRSTGRDAGERTATGVFGSVAIPFSRIGTRSSWLRVHAAPSIAASIGCRKDEACARRAAQLAAAARSAEKASFIGKLRAVNDAVNSHIAYQADYISHNAVDYWSTPAETIARGAGDCEDFANMKLRMLNELGVPARSMSLVVVKDVRRNLFHAVLAITTNKGNFILDNVDNRILTDRDLPQYLPLYSFSEDRSWIHGFSRGAKNIARLDVSEFDRINPGEGFSEQPRTKQLMSGATTSALRSAL